MGNGAAVAYSNVKLPNNYYGALNRLKLIEKRLDSDSKFANLYYHEMERLFQEGYAVEVDLKKRAGENIWYLPHFGVSNINKPDKVRLVFDARHSYQGTSLNGVLIPGPII